MMNSPCAMLMTPMTPKVIAKPDGRQEIDRGKRDRVQRQIGCLVHRHLGLDARQRRRRRGRNGRRRSGVGLEEDANRASVSSTSASVATGSTTPSAGQGGIGQVARLFAIQARHLNARHPIPVDIRDQRLPLVVAADPRLGELRAHQQIVSRLARQRL